MTCKWMLILAASAATMFGEPLSPTLSADIPFSFRVGDQIFEPGVYRIVSNANPWMIAIKNESGRTLAMTHVLYAERRDQNGPPVLVFNRYAGAHYLSQVWRGGVSGAQLRPARS